MGDQRGLILLETDVCSLWPEYDPGYQWRYAFTISNVFTYSILDSDNNTISDSNADFVTNKYEAPSNASPSDPARANC